MPHPALLRAGVLGLLLLLAAGLGACGATEPTGSSDPTSPPVASGDVAYFQLRPVLQVSSEPGPCAKILVPPEEPGWFCTKTGTPRYRLGPAVLTGANVASAEAGLPQGATTWAVNVSFDEPGTKLFADLTAQLLVKPPPRNQVAIVIGGLVASAPVIQARIDGGLAQITGDFTEQQATQLAERLATGSAA